MNIRLTLLLAAGLLTACQDGDDIGRESYYTFRGETVSSLCEHHPERFSMMHRVLRESGQETLLATYGHYTCFAPNNEAVATYLQGKGL